jgi:ribosomal protein S18 acetylase RimI-like enzyme
MTAPASIRLAEESDDSWLNRVFTESWGSNTVVSRGREHRLDRLPCLIAEVDAERCGVATYSIEGDSAELVTIEALQPGRGVGSALLSAVIERVKHEGCRRLWLVTSNDNLDAVRFYQRRGFRLVAVHIGAVDAARGVKPQIPEMGSYGIAIHDEIELALELQ